MEEIMENEMDVMNVGVDLNEVEGNSGVSTGIIAAVAFGVGVLVTKGIEFGMKLWKDHKAKQEAAQVVARDTIDPADKSDE